jgi:hypothetical protein
MSSDYEPPAFAGILSARPAEERRQQAAVPYERPGGTGYPQGGRERRKRQAAAAFLVVPPVTYKLAREKQSVQQRGREFIVVRAAGAMLTFGAKLRRGRTIRRVL